MGILKEEEPTTEWWSSHRYRFGSDKEKSAYIFCSEGYESNQLFLCLLSKWLTLFQNDVVGSKLMLQLLDTKVSNMCLCPLTYGPDMAGLPLGKVYFTVFHCETVEQVYASYLKELVRLK